MGSIHCLVTVITVITLAAKTAFALPEVIRIGKSNRIILLVLPIKKVGRVFKKFLYLQEFSNCKISKYECDQQEDYLIAPILCPNQPSGKP